MIYKPYQYYCYLLKMSHILSLIKIKKENLLIKKCLLPAL